MTLNSFYHESFKKWLKGKCSRQATYVSDSFEEGGLSAHYDAQRKVFIIDPGEKEYPRQMVENTLQNEEEFNQLVTEMHQQNLS